MDVPKVKSFKNSNGRKVVKCKICNTEIWATQCNFNDHYERTHLIGIMEIINNKIVVETTTVNLATSQNPHKIIKTVGSRV